MSSELKKDDKYIMVCIFMAYLPQIYIIFTKTSYQAMGFPIRFDKICYPVLRRANATTVFQQPSCIGGSKLSCFPISSEFASFLNKYFTKN